MPDYDSDRIHCEIAAEQALRDGRDPLDAAIRAIRPSGLVTYIERQIATWAAETAIRNRRTTTASSYLNRPLRTFAEAQAQIRRAS